MSNIDATESKILSGNTSMVIKKTLLNEILMVKEGSGNGANTKKLFHEEGNELKIGASGVKWGGTNFAIGEQGDKGPEGEQGAQGANGNNGNNGQVGDNGDSPKGENGDVGDDNTTSGDDGDDGQQNQGPPGANGANFNGFDFGSGPTQFTHSNGTLVIKNNFKVTNKLIIEGTATQMTLNEVSMTDKIIDLNTDGDDLTNGQGIEVYLSGGNQKMQWNGTKWEFKDASNLQDVRAGEIEIGQHDANNGGRLNFSDSNLSIQYLSTGTSPDILDDGLFIVNNGNVHTALGVFERD